MQEYSYPTTPIEERAVMVAQYIVEHNATVRQAASQFGVSKSTVHKDVTKGNGLECWAGFGSGIKSKKCLTCSIVHFHI